MEKQIQYRDVSLEEFVREFALMIVERRALQAALLMLLGDKASDIRTLVCDGDEVLYRAVIAELTRVGFVKESVKH